MRTIEADSGEYVYDFLKRALNEVKDSDESTAKAEMNGATIYIFKNSCIEDLCDKYDLQRKIDRFESQDHN